MHIRTLAALTLLAALALAPTASAKEVTLNVTARDDEGTAYYFVVDNGTEQNPEISLAPGDAVTVNFVNEGTMVHNVRFGAPINQATAILQNGQRETLTFTVPSNATGETTYWCDPHQGLGMEGPLVFAAGTTPPTGNGNEPPENAENGTPAPGVLLVALGAVAAALVARRRRA